MEIYDNSQKERSGMILNKSVILTRIGILLILLIGVSLNSAYGWTLPQSEINCYKDYSFVYSESLSIILNSNEGIKNIFVVLTSLAADIIFLFLGYLWICKFRSWRFMTNLIIFFAFKTVIKFISKETTPTGFSMSYPGFPSIIINYLNTHDFFISTPIGFLTLSSLELWKNGYKKLFTLSFTTLLIESSTRILLRGNYIIDILSAVILAHFIYILVNENLMKIDKIFNKACE